MQKHNKLPIKATPYEHQVKAYDFVCDLFGLEGGDASIISKNSAALLMEMG